MAGASDEEWAGYYAAIEGRAPRALFDRFRSYYRADRTLVHAVDLGCGDGTETRVMLADGLSVVAVDGSSASTQLVRERVGSDPKLTVIQARLEEVSLPPTDLIYSGFTLPFCRPGSFDSLWTRLSLSLRPGGLLAVHLFGHNHGWSGQVHMTFLTPAQMTARASAFEILDLREIDEIEPSATGDLVRMHVFELIARKPSGSGRGSP